MAKLNDDSLDELTKEIKKLTGIMSRSGNAGNKRNSSKGYSTNSSGLTKEEAKELDGKKKLNRSINDLTDTMTLGDKDTKQFIDQVGQATRQTMDMVKGFGSFTLALSAGVALANTAIGHMRDNMQAYRDMTNVGQTFNGSIMDMSKAAADAKLPLRDFTELIKKNATAASVLGTKGLGDLGKGLRSSLHDFNMLNLTTNDLNDFMGNYLETQQSYGLLNRMSNMESIESLQRLSLETTILSQTFGKNRLELQKTTEQAMQNEHLRTMMLNDQVSGNKEVGESVRTMLQYFSAMPGKVGEILPQFLAESFGKGAAELSSYSQELASAGMGQLVSLANEMTTMARNGHMTNEQMEQYRLALTNELEASVVSLKNRSLVDDAGGKAASNLLLMLTELRNYEEIRLKNEAEIPKSITAMLMMADETYKNLVSDTRTMFFGIGDSIVEAIGEDNLKEMIDSAASALKTFGGVIGNMIKTVFSPTNVEIMGAMFKTVMAVATGLVKTITNVMKAFDGFLPTLMALGTALVAFKSSMWAISKMKNLFGGSGVKGLRPIDQVRVVGGAMLVKNIGGTGGKGRTTTIADRDRAKRGGSTTPSSKGGKLTGIGKIGMGGLIAGTLVNSMVDTDSAAGAALSDMVEYASIGAMLGSVIPGIGTGIGAAAGGLIGGGKALYNNWDSINIGDSIMSGLDYIGSGITGAASGIWDFFSGSSTPTTPSTPQTQLSGFVDPNMITYSMQALQTGINTQNQINTDIRNTIVTTVETWLTNMADTKGYTTETLDEIRRMVNQLKAISDNTSGV